MLEASLRIFDPIGLNHEVEHMRYRNEALRFAWHGLPPERFAEIDLDGTLYHQRPSLDLDLGSYRLRTNSLGYRGPEIAKSKPAGTFRILVLGDSVAYGTGVDEEVTFLRRWEVELNASGRGRFEVVNTGHPMYDTTQELAILRDEGLALEPDLVLLVYVVNDIEPTRDVVEQALFGKLPDPAEALPDPGDCWTWLAARIAPVLPATAKLVQLQSDPLTRLLSTQPPGTEYVPERFGKGPRGWPRSQRALEQIAALCRAAHVPFALLDDTMPALRALPGWCREHGIDYHDFRFTPEELHRPIRNSMLDSHANAAGHELLLQKLRAIAAELPMPR
ncbi:MAG: SGNH/GDSL hydrolase family protein [Planctomycetes bacterium]|nr:SGNH/GDSL hydrolase family protein [Planctomycetota bacterium]